jgi:hypothetical protein
MKYTKEMTDRLLKDYQGGVPTQDIALELDVPERSVIAKLSALGVYKKKEYRNKRGEVPIKKEQYIERIADLLNVQIDILESLEKCNKNVLKLLEEALKKE